MSAIESAITAAGGPIAAAKACGLSRQAIDKWIVKGTLPRTEFTGETAYASALAKSAAERGAPFDSECLLAECRQATNNHAA